MLLYLFHSARSIVRTAPDVVSFYSANPFNPIPMRDGLEWGSLFQAGTISDSVEHVNT